MLLFKFCVYVELHGHGIIFVYYIHLNYNFSSYLYVLCRIYNTLTGRNCLSKTEKIMHLLKLCNTSILHIAVFRKLITFTECHYLYTYYCWHAHTIFTYVLFLCNSVGPNLVNKDLIMPFYEFMILHNKQVKIAW